MFSICLPFSWMNKQACSVCLLVLGSYEVISCKIVSQYWSIWEKIYCDFIYLFVYLLCHFCVLAGEEHHLPCSEGFGGDFESPRAKACPLIVPPV